MPPTVMSADEHRLDLVDRRDGGLDGAVPRSSTPQGFYRSFRFFGAAVA
jgi:hypothetical protein